MSASNFPLLRDLPWQRIVPRLIAWLLLATLALLFLIPLLWMLSTSLKEPSDLVGFKWIPSRLAWENYEYAFSFGL